MPPQLVKSKPIKNRWKHKISQYNSFHHIVSCRRLTVPDTKSKSGCGDFTSFEKKEARQLSVSDIFVALHKFAVTSGNNGSSQNFFFFSLMYDAFSLSVLEHSLLLVFKQKNSLPQNQVSQFEIDHHQQNHLGKTELNQDKKRKPLFSFTCIPLICEPIKLLKIQADTITSEDFCLDHLLKSTMNLFHGQVPIKITNYKNARTVKIVNQSPISKIKNKFTYAIADIITCLPFYKQANLLTLSYSAIKAIFSFWNQGIGPNNLQLET